jgi:Tfp pilus assembly protein FimT
VSTKATHGRRFGDERGFSIVQLLIVLCIVGIIAGMAVFGLRSARATVGLNNSAREFAQNAEKARLDAIRRRTTTHIEFTGPTTYEVTMDFTGDGVDETRAFTLDSGVVLTDASGATMTTTSADLPYTDFDWRGRTYDCNALFRMKNARSDQMIVQIAGSGDISVNSAVTGLPTVTYANVNTTADVNPSATLTGADPKLNLSPCGTTSATPPPTPTPSPTPTPDADAPPDEDPPCSMTASPTVITGVQRKGGSTASLAITVNRDGTIVKTVNSNLTATTASSEVITASGGATITYTVKSSTNTWGSSYPIKFEFSNCSPVTVNVGVIK